jgi:hypothetical protein
MRSLQARGDLAVSLPDAPLTRFRLKTAGLPRTTEAERLVAAQKAKAASDFSSRPLGLQHAAGGFKQ